MVDRYYPTSSGHYGEGYMVQSEAGDWVAYEDHLAAELRFEELEGELCKMLPGVQYMDPPDGGSVTPIEQVHRMIADLKKQNETNEALLYAMRQDMRDSREKMESMLVDNVTLKSIVPTEPGLYAIRYLDNWDGEGHSYLMIAQLESEGKWTCEESGKTLLEYEGDKVLQAWPLFDVATPATDVIIREIRAEGIDMLVADKVFEWMDSYSADASKFAAQLRAGNVEGGD